MKKITAVLLSVAMVFSLAACSNGTDAVSQDGNRGADSNATAETGAGGSAATELNITFGDHTFVMHLEDNETAHQVAQYVGEESWNLPIYHFDDYENYEVMQYYDVASSYDFTANPEMITSEKAGEVFYSDPNRIVLFYQDAEVSGEYTKIGEVEYSQEFYDAVVNNPVVEGWSNKIVTVSPVE